MSKNAVLILSGGIDSTTLLYDRAESIALAISFDYGSNHNKKEIECARWHCEHLAIPHVVIPLEFMGKYFKSSLLSGSESIPEGHYEDENMKSTVVPFRNGIMLAIAAGMAESRDLDTVMIANHGGDHAIYPDCRDNFIKAMGEATAFGTYNNVKVVGPYTNITKGEIVAIGKRLGVDYSHTYSCYKGGDKHCGKCGTCVERAEAFEYAGLQDPTDYEA